MDRTLRQQLHAAADAAEEAKADLERMTARYNEARHALNCLIDTVTPIDQPNGRTVTQKVVSFPHTIALIKLLRCETLNYARKVTNTNDVPCMGLKEAKDIAEKFINDERIVRE